MKVVVNRCYGGFGLSNPAFEEYLTRKGIKYYVWMGEYSTPMFTTVPKEEYQGIHDQFLSYYHIDRADPVLVAVVEEWGERAYGDHASLEVVDVPDDVQWTIEEYDGSEWVAEVHRTW